MDLTISYKGRRGQSTKVQLGGVITDQQAIDFANHFADNCNRDGFDSGMRISKVKKKMVMGGLPRVNDGVKDTIDAWVTVLCSDSVSRVNKITVSSTVTDTAIRQAFAVAFGVTVNEVTVKSSISKR